MVSHALISVRVLVIRPSCKIRRAICSGFFFHSAKKDPQEGYKTVVENTPTYIHPASALFQRQPDWVCYHELVLTSKVGLCRLTR